MVGDENQDAMGTAPASTGRSLSDEAGPSTANNNNLAQGKRLWKRLLLGALGVLLLAIAAVVGVPWIKEALNG